MFDIILRACPGRPGTKACKFSDYLAKCNELQRILQIFKKKKDTAYSIFRFLKMNTTPTMESSITARMMTQAHREFMSGRLTFIP